MILNNLISKIEVTDEQYKKLSSIITLNPKILNSSDFLKLNRSVSYMTFIIKELCDFILMKTVDGLPVYKLKDISQEIDSLRGKISKLKDHLK